MKRKYLLHSAFLACIAFSGLYSFLYLNTVATNDNVEQLEAPQFGENKIIEEGLDKLEEKKTLAETFLLEKLIEAAKNIIP